MSTSLTRVAKKHATFPIRISAADMGKKFGPPPYAKPEDVPPMSRALIALFVSGAINSEHTHPDIFQQNIKALEEQAARGMLPPGCFKAWGLPEHPAYAHLCATKQIAKIRENHHLAATNERVAFVRHCRNAFKKHGHCDAANVLSRFLMIIEQNRELLGNRNVEAFSGLERAIVDAAYQWVYAYAKSYGLGQSPLLNYVPTPMDHEFEQLQDQFAALRYAHTHAPDTMELTLTPREPRDNITLSPETKKKIGHAARRAASGAASASRGLADLLDQLATPPERKAKRMRDNQSEQKLPAKAQKALNDYAKAHGYNYVHAMVTAPRKVEAYLLQQEGDNYGQRVVATSNVMGNWTVAPFTTGTPRKQLRNNLADGDAADSASLMRAPVLPVEALSAFYAGQRASSRAKRLPRESAVRHLGQLPAPDSLVEFTGTPKPKRTRAKKQK